MLQLPQEVLYEIFCLLHQEDQLQCMLVCSHFKTLIEQSTLFQSPYVTSVAGIDALISKIKKEPSIGNKFKHLALTKGGKDAFKRLNTLLRLLPNLETFFADSDSDQGATNRRSLKGDHGKYWSKNIKQLIEVSSNIVTGQLFNCDSLPKLTTLYISGAAGSGKIIPLLKKAPLLQHLTFGGPVKMTFADLNIINESLPQLRSIVFKRISLRYRTTSSIIPAPLVVDCTFESEEGGDVNERIQFTNYIRQAYPNLQKLVFNMYNSMINDLDAKRLVDDGWLPFFKACGSRLNTLHIDEDEYDFDFFDALDKSGSQICNLNVHCTFKTFKVIKNTQQLSYIETLYLCSDVQKDFEFIKHFKVLKELTVDAYFTRNGVHLDEEEEEYGVECLSFNKIVENAPPTLKSLSFVQVEYLACNITTNSTRVNNIEHLSFAFTLLPLNVDRFLSTNFPRLRKLDMDDCDFYGKTFNLVTTNLSCFTLKSRSINHDKILVITLRDNKMRYVSPLRYHNDQGVSSSVKAFLYPPVRSTPANDGTLIPFFTLICNSVDNIYLSKKKP